MPCKKILPVVEVISLSPNTNAPLPVLMVTDVAVTSPVNAIPALRPFALTSKELPTEKLPSWSIMLFVLMMDIAEVVAADKVFMSILSVAHEYVFCTNEPPTVSFNAIPALTPVAGALVVILVMVLYVFVVVTVLLLSVVIVSVITPPAAFVPVIVNVTPLLAFGLVSVICCAVRKRKPSCISTNDPAPEIF